ncbi:tyrosine-type recombinase/integrase [Acidisoma sp. L85]|uniref:tyrosine-type recombinase/integrase n=1 Tax=Acidisoma sp. L85 TaxID=1641850 RepID=UPI001C2026CD|nr:tyrosine-type recombinase/integrase [Acidisoma sp. L85]
MTTMISPTLLDRPIATWLAHQRALGCRYDLEEWVLNSLRRFIGRTPGQDLDRETFDRWCATFPHLASNTLLYRQRIVRRFCLHRRRKEPDCFVPASLYFARPEAFQRPVIIEPEQIARMLTAVSKMPATSGSPLRSEVYRMAVILLYTTRLRRGELLRLTLADCDPESGVLRVRGSKFHKSRILPLSTDAHAELRDYLHMRLAPPFSKDPDTPLLINAKGGPRPYTGTGISGGIGTLFKAAHVQDSEGRCPRVHDLRYSFAVGALIRWYLEGADVQSNLPKLAMYMGHVSIVSTAHYLHFIPKLRAIASDRFESAFGDLVREAVT